MALCRTNGSVRSEDGQGEGMLGRPPTVSHGPDFVLHAVATFLFPVALHRMGMIVFVSRGVERTKFGFASSFDLDKYCAS